MDPDIVTVVSGVVSTAASVGAFIVALVALLRTRRNKAAVLDAQVESDFVARVLAKVLRLMSDDARGEAPGLELKELSAKVPRENGVRPVIAELESAFVEYEKLSPREQRMYDDGPWSTYDGEADEEDPRSR